MKATICLCSGEKLEVTGFQKVSYQAIEWKSLTSEQFDRFHIDSTRTYNFMGANSVSVKGSDIEFVLLT